MNTDLRMHLLKIAGRDILPRSHRLFLRHMKVDMGFVPRICYDLGSCALHWTNSAKCIWPDAEYILFDAYSPAEFLYADYKYHIGILSDSDDRTVKWYQNDIHPGGNSYYREFGTGVFPASEYTVRSTRSLDSIVKEREFPLPDLIKIDVQGCELDILKGAAETLKHAKYLIVELQHKQYNEGAPLAPITIEYLESQGWKCIAERFSSGQYDGDYCFENMNLR